MKKKTIALLLTTTLISGLLSACGNSSQTSDIISTTDKKADVTSEVINLTDNSSETATSVNIDYTIDSYAPVSDFGYHLFQKNTEGTTNPVLSPVSAYIALTMAGNGANGTTKDEFYQLLGSNGEMTALSDDMMNRFPTDSENLKLSLANSAWIDNEFTPDKEWLGTISSLYDAQAYHADLSTREAVDSINQWVSDNTQGLIKKMIEQPFEDDARLVLFNTLYFKGTWRDPFIHEMTYEQPFTTSDGKSVNVSMMHQRKSYYDYLTNDYAEGVILPYADSNLSLVALSPREGTTVRELSNMLTSDMIVSLLDNRQESTYMNIDLPKFEITFDQILNDSLIELGLESAFDADKADLTGLGKADHDGNIYISLVRQKADIRLDEEGTEAAAATEIAMAEATSLDIEQPLNMVFDHPFLYMIMDMDTQIPLFIGIIDNPNA